MNGLFRNFDLLSVGIAVASTVILGFVVWFNNRKSITNFSFLLFCLMTSGWGIVNYLNYQIDRPEIAFWFIRLTVFLAVWQAYAIFQFFYVFPKEQQNFSRLYKFLFLPWIFFTSFLTLTPLVFAGIAQISPEGRIVSIVNGPAIPLFGLTAIGLVVSALGVLVMKIKKARGLEKTQLLSILIGTVLMFALIIIFNFLLPAFFNNPYFIPLGAIFTLPFLAMTSYAILAHKFLNTRVITTEIFILILLFISLLDLVQARNLNEVLVRGLVFIGLIVFGVLLIKGVLHEVEQRERLEKLTRELETANASLKKLDELKSQFLSFASHQIKGPLTVIRGYADLISEGSYGQINGGVSKAVWGIKENSRRLIKLVDDFLDLRKIEEGRMDYEFKTVNLVGLAKSVFEEFKIIGQQKGLKLELRADEEIINLKADEQRLRQVIQNLIDNAIKYTPEGGVKVKIEKTKTGDRAIFEVKDSGVGIRPKIIGTIFNQFNRDPKLRNILGTGLGLYIAKEIVRAHQGKIWAESEGKNKGATFYVELPLS